MDRVASLPKRRRDIRVRLIPLAVLFFAATALPTFHQDRAEAARDLWSQAAAASEIEAVASSSVIADEALKDLGTWQGQCFTWVKKVVDRATSYTMGYGYRDGYIGAGAIEVPLSQAVRGDIIQLANDSLSQSSTYLGLHTAIVLENLGGGVFDVIDSNQNWDEIVRLRPGYEPLAAAARYPGISVHVYRFPGGSATDAPPPPATQLEPGTPAIVDAGGDCLRLRDAAGLSGNRLDCLPDGTTVSITGSAVIADGLAWVPVDTPAGAGWMAAVYLTAAPDAAQADDTVEPPADEAPAAADTSSDPGSDTTIANVEADAFTLAIPPQGGLTHGLAGTDDPLTLIEAQAFPVKTLSVFDISSQSYLTYIPGAPAHVNTLTSDDLEPDSIVSLKRDESGAATSTSVSAVPVTGVTAFPAPPAEGLTQGIAGTTDVASIIAAQSFPVQTVSAWDITTQRFLTYIPGAPAHVSTLNSSTLKPDMVVMLKRGSGTTAPVQSTPPVDQRTASITYYYCTPGSIAAGIGDGGGWCGTMASGVVVYEGAAACAAEYMGQKFKILGDPNGRIYTCADTGSAVTGEHRDIFFHNSDDGYQWWQQVGATATIEIVG